MRDMLTGAVGRIVLSALYVSYERSHPPAAPYAGIAFGPCVRVIPGP